MLKADKHQGIHTVSCLADLSCFYDTVNLDHIIEPARILQYPVLHLKLALDLYTGPRTIQAEGISEDPTHYQRGVLQGCPQAPAISKLILYRPLKQLVQTHPDDVSYDIQGRDPAYVAREALLAFRALKAELEVAGLTINTDKTGFITSAKEVSKELNLLLTPEDPAHYDVLRDLGVDATATRRRRVMQVKKRFNKGSARTGILHVLHRLRLAPTTKYRLHRGAIHPVMTRGAQANGLPPQRRQKLRVLAARGLRLQRSGSVDVVFDLHPKLPDPADSIICQHIHTVWKLYHAFREGAQHLFWTTWNTALGALLKAKYRWQVVSGPMQALQAYLLDYEFDNLQRQAVEAHRIWRHS